MSLISGNALFVGAVNCTQNIDQILGCAIFCSGAINSGITDNAIFCNSINKGTGIGSSIIFNNSTNSGKISGCACFGYNSKNFGQIDGTGDFNESSVNIGNVCNLILCDQSFNSGIYNCLVFLVNYNSPTNRYNNSGIYFTYTSGNAFSANGPYSDHYYSSGALSFCTTTPNEENAIDNGCLYLYESGKALSATGQDNKQQNVIFADYVSGADGSGDVCYGVRKFYTNNNTGLIVDRYYCNQCLIMVEEILNHNIESVYDFVPNGTFTDLCCTVECQCLYNSYQYVCNCYDVFDENNNCIGSCEEYATCNEYCTVYECVCYGSCENCDYCSVGCTSVPSFRFGEYGLLIDSASEECVSFVVSGFVCPTGTIICAQQITATCSGRPSFTYGSRQYILSGSYNFSPSDPCSDVASTGVKEIYCSSGTVVSTGYLLYPITNIGLSIGTFSLASDGVGNLFQINNAFASGTSISSTNITNQGFVVGVSGYKSNGVDDVFFVLNYSGSGHVFNISGVNVSCLGITTTVACVSKIADGTGGIFSQNCFIYNSGDLIVNTGIPISQLKGNLFSDSKFALPNGQSCAGSKICAYPTRFTIENQTIGNACLISDGLSGISAETNYCSSGTLLAILNDAECFTNFNVTTPFSYLTSSGKVYSDGTDSSYFELNYGPEQFVCEVDLCEIIFSGYCYPVTYICQDEFDEYNSICGYSYVYSTGNPVPFILTCTTRRGCIFYDGSGSLVLCGSPSCIYNSGNELLFENSGVECCVQSYGPNGYLYTEIRTKYIFTTLEAAASLTTQNVYAKYNGQTYINDSPIPECALSSCYLGETYDFYFKTVDAFIGCGEPIITTGSCLFSYFVLNETTGLLGISIDRSFCITESLPSNITLYTCNTTSQLQDYSDCCTFTNICVSGSKSVIATVSACDNYNVIPCYFASSGIIVKCQDFAASYSTYCNSNQTIYCIFDNIYYYNIADGLHYSDEALTCLSNITLISVNCTSLCILTESCIVDGIITGAVSCY